MRTSRRITIAVIVGLSSLIILTGCSNTTENDPQGATEQHTSTTPAPTGASSAPAPAQDPKLTAAWKKFTAEVDDISAGPAVNLAKLSAPATVAGYSQADTNVFADRAKDLMARSIDPALSTKEAEDGIYDLFRNQHPNTQNNYEVNADRDAGGGNWEWRALSRFKADKVAAPKVFATKWFVTTGTGAYDDGTQHTTLRVILQAAIRHDITIGGTVYPIVVYRGVHVSGFNPSGGQNWWPGVYVTTKPVGNAACGLTLSNTLVAAQDAKAVDSERKTLRPLLAQMNRELLAWNFYPPKYAKQMLRSCREQATAAN